MFSAAARARDAGRVWSVLQVLVLRVGVDGGHQSLDDAELVVEHLGQRPRQFVVARGVEMMFWLPSYLSSLTPNTIVMSGSCGAEMMTFLAPASRWPLLWRRW